MPSVVIARGSPESRSTESTELQLSPLTQCAGIDHVVEGSSTGKAIQGSENRDAGDSKSTCVKAIDFAEVEVVERHELAGENNDTIVDAEMDPGFPAMDFEKEAPVRLSSEMGELLKLQREQSESMDDYWSQHKFVSNWSDVLEGHWRNFGAGLSDFDELESSCPTGEVEEEDHWSQPIQKTPSAGHPCRTLEKTK